MATDSSRRPPPREPDPAGSGPLTTGNLLRTRIDDRRIPTTNHPPLRVDEFAVVRNGTTIFDDSFNRNNTLNGGSETVLPSGTTFSDGTAANYRVVGSFPKTTGEQRPGTAEYRERFPGRSAPAIHPAHPGGFRRPTDRHGPRRAARLDTGAAP
jgi:hypothetical protein